MTKVLLHFRRLMQRNIDLATHDQGSVHCQRLGDYVDVFLENITGITSAQPVIARVPDGFMPSSPRTMVVDAQRADNGNWTQFSLVVLANGAIVPVNVPANIMAASYTLRYHI